MHEKPTPELAAAYRRLREFRQGTTEERVFAHPTCHPANPTGFCYCEGSWWKAIRFYLKAAFLGLAFKLPFQGLKAWALRRLGARVGSPVFFSAGVWIDPMFPELLTIEDEVFFGMGVKVLTHEFLIDEFRAGRVLIRRGAFLGGFAVIRCGVEIGAGAVVAAGTIAARDVPAGATLITPPGRIVRVGHMQDASSRSPLPPGEG
jgi:acetyltransferase-like isoleucine patch superfamily enzyme